MELSTEQLLMRMENLLPELQPYYEEGNGFPMLRHPLVYSVPHFPQLNALTNERYRHMKRVTEELKASSNESDLSHFVFLHERPYRPEAFSEICDRLSEEKYWETLHNLWVDTENPHANRELWEEFFTSRENTRLFMDEEERAEFNAMPDTIIAYRGFDPTVEEEGTGISWTLSEEKAQWFANRFGREGKVCRREFRKCDVFAYTNRRGEQEIIILQ